MGRPGRSPSQRLAKYEQSWREKRILTRRSCKSLRSCRKQVDFFLHVPVDGVGAVEPIERFIAENLSYPDLDGAENVGHDKDMGKPV